MPGGGRKGIGGKLKWKCGKTRIVRIPEMLLDPVLRFAQYLDDTYQVENSESTLMDYPKVNTINLAGITITKTRGQSYVLLKDLVKRGYRILPQKLMDSI